MKIVKKYHSGMEKASKIYEFTFGCLYDIVNAGHKRKKKPLRRKYKL